MSLYTTGCSVAQDNLKFHLKFIQYPDITNVFTPILWKLSCFHMMPLTKHPKWNWEDGKSWSYCKIVKQTNPIQQQLPQLTPQNGPESLANSQWNLHLETLSYWVAAIWRCKMFSDYSKCRPYTIISWDQVPVESGKYLVIQELEFPYSIHHLSQVLQQDQT